MRVSDFISIVKMRRAEVAESLAAGHVTSFESYQRLVGRIQGLDESLEIINSLLKEPDDDE